MNYIVYERTDSGVSEIAKIINNQVTGSQAESILEILTDKGYPAKDPMRILHGSRLWAAELDVELEMGLLAAQLLELHGTHDQKSHGNEHANPDRPVQKTPYGEWRDSDLDKLGTSIIKDGLPNECYENARREFIARKEKGENAIYRVGEVYGLTKQAYYTYDYKYESLDEWLSSDKVRNALPIGVTHAWVESEGIIYDPTPFKNQYSDRDVLKKALDNFFIVKYVPRLKVADEKDLLNELDYFPKLRELGGKTDRDGDGRGSGNFRDDLGSEVTYENYYPQYENSLAPAKKKQRAINTLEAWGVAEEISVGVNKALRNSKGIASIWGVSDFQQEIRDIDFSFNVANSFAEDTIVYRAVKNVPSNRFIDYGFVSTTLDKELAHGIAKQINGKVYKVIIPKGVKILAIPSNSQVKEILINRGQSYEVIDGVMRVK